MATISEVVISRSTDEHWWLDVLREADSMGSERMHRRILVQQMVAGRSMEASARLDGLLDYWSRVREHIDGRCEMVLQDCISQARLDEGRWRAVVAAVQHEMAR